APVDFRVISSSQNPDFLTMLKNIESSPCNLSQVASLTSVFVRTGVTSFNGTISVPASKFYLLFTNPNQESLIVTLNAYILPQQPVTFITSQTSYFATIVSSTGQYVVAT